MVHQRWCKMECRWHDPIAVFAIALALWMMFTCCIPSFPIPCVKDLLRNHTSRMLQCNSDKMISES